TGLGLSVSYGIIERHGGLISVESEVNQGTTFMIDLAAARSTVARLSTLQEQQDAPALSILVVDDEEVVRETLSEMLVVMGHTVASVGSGQEALERLASKDHYDMVFTDLSMPEMDGWEVAREVRRRCPEVAIALVTGYGKGTEPPSGEKNLIDGAIGKPFDFEEVREAIAQVSGVGGRVPVKENSLTPGT
ncbi:MAG: response regulator, partial [Acidobacteria bacterium]|nr:response regulator [Acidobacteriota bacterium]